MKEHHVIKSASVIGSLTLLSRCFGMIRDILIFNFLGGTSLISSAFYLAFTLPNLFRRLFGEGALSASFIPIFIETSYQNGSKDAWDLSRRIGTLIFIALFLICLIGLLLFSIGSNISTLNDKWIITFNLSKIMFPYLIFICLTALSMGILHSKNHFIIPAFSPILLNTILIGCMLIYFPNCSTDLEKVKILSWSVIIAGASQLFIQIPILKAKGAKLLPLNPFNDYKVKKVLLLMAPIALGAAVTQFNVVIDKILAMWIGSWAPAALTFSERLIYLPLGIFATALGTVLLPAFSHQVEKSNFNKINETLQNSLAHIFYVMIPASIGLLVLAEPIIQSIFNWTNHQNNSIEYIYRALICYAPGLVIFSVAKLIIPVFYSLKDMRTPVRVSIYVVIFNFLLNILSIIVFPEFWKHAGLAISTVIAEGIGIYLLAKKLDKRIKLIPKNIIIKKLFSIIWRSLLMGLFVYLLYNKFFEIFDYTEKIQQLFLTFICIISGIVFYLLLSIKQKEQQEILKILIKND